MRNRKIYKLMKSGVYFLSVLLLVIGILACSKYLSKKQLMTKYELIDASTQEQDVTESEEGTLEAKGVMSQEEMEDVISKHKINSVKNMDLSEDENAVIDFVGLQKINKDVYAWISIPGTKIEYPILQHPTDNSYYLNYCIDGSYGYPGCIYTEKENVKDFSDPNTIIYGHNMKNGTMFAGLHQYLDEDFFNQCRSIIIYTPQLTYYYRVFAAYIYDDRHLLYSFDFHNKEVYSSYLQDIYERRDMSSNIDKSLSVTSDDKIITLVTCLSKQPDKRLLIQAVLMNE